MKDECLAACNQIWKTSYVIFGFSCRSFSCRSEMIAIEFKPPSGGFEYVSSQLAPDVARVQYQSSLLRLRLRLRQSLSTVDERFSAKQDV